MYQLLNLTSWLLSRLSPRALDRCAKVLAFLVFSVLRLRRKLVLGNIATAFGGELSPHEQKQVGYQSFYHFTLTMLEFLSERHGRLGDGVALEGSSHMAEALQAGQGAYILCIHLGSWEAMAGAISRELAPANVVVKRVGSPAVDRFIRELRVRNGFYPILREKKGDGMQMIRDRLTKGQIVGFVMDQARPNSPLLPFFGQPAKTNTSFAAIWRRQPAPIVPAFIRRTGVGQHTLTFYPALRLQSSGEEAKDVAEHSAYFNEVVEGMIRQCPEQYFWLHNRWKS